MKYSPRIHRHPRRVHITPGWFTRAFASSPSARPSPSPRLPCHSPSLLPPPLPPPPKILSVVRILRLASLTRFVRIFDGGARARAPSRNLFAASTRQRETRNDVYARDAPSHLKKKKSEKERRNETKVSFAAVARTRVPRYRGEPLERERDYAFRVPNAFYPRRDCCSVRFGLRIVVTRYGGDMRTISSA